MKEREVEAKKRQRKKGIERRREKDEIKAKVGAAWEEEESS